MGDERSFAWLRLDNSAIESSFIGSVEQVSCRLAFLIGTRYRWNLDQIAQNMGSLLE
jgi:hypothetical protein